MQWESVPNPFLWYNSHVVLLPDTSFLGEDKSMENLRCWHNISRKRQNIRETPLSCLQAMKTFEHLDTKNISLCQRISCLPKENIFPVWRKYLFLPKRETFSACTKEISFTVRRKYFLPKRGKRFSVGGESGENVCVFVRDKDLFAFQGERGL